MNSSVEAWRLLREIGVGLFVGSAIAAAGLIMLLRPLLQRYALARPNARSSHKTPTPQGGGIAVAGVTIAAVAIAVIAFPEFNAASVAPMLVAAAALAVMGAVDDIHTLEPAPRLALQFLAVLLMIVALPPELRVAPLLPWWLERALLLIAMVWFVNLVNFMDGIDWMTVAEVVPIVGGVIVIGLLGALPAYGMIVAIALCGAILGFAPFNRPVAKLFLGDVGSLPIGLFLGWLHLLVAARGHLIAAVLLPLYYLADATITLLLRAIRGETLWRAHRDHFYQRAVDRGFTVSQVVTRVFVTNLLLVGLALFTTLSASILTHIAALVAGVILVSGLLFTFRRGCS